MRALSVLLNLLVGASRATSADTTDVQPTYNDGTNPIEADASKTIDIATAAITRYWNESIDLVETTFIDSSGQKRNCTWLSQELLADTTNQTNITYCHPPHNDPPHRLPLAAVICPHTCRREVVIPKNANECKDTSALVGNLDTTKRKKKCKWIAKSKRRIAKYCTGATSVSIQGDNDELEFVEGGGSIQSRGDAACPKTCGKCPPAIATSADIPDTADAAGRKNQSDPPRPPPALACTYSGHYPLYCNAEDARLVSPSNSSREVRFWDKNNVPVLYMPEGLAKGETYFGTYEGEGEEGGSVPLCECAPDPKAHPSYENDSKKRKNVLFLVIDDLRMMDFGNSDGSGDEYWRYTPNLDDFATNHSMLFTNAHVQQAICAASRASALTGRRPDTTGVYDLNTYWRDIDTGGRCPSCKTLPQLFKESGYKDVVGMGKIFHPGPYSGYNDIAHSWTEYGTTGIGAHKDGKAYKSVTEDEEAEQALDDTLIVDQALEYMAKFSDQSLSENEKEPWFMAVGLKKPHLPFTCPSRFFDAYSQPDLPIADNDYVCPDDPIFPFPKDAHASYELQSYDGAFVAELDDGTTTKLSSDFVGRSKTCEYRIDDDQTRKLTQAYHACVSHVDEEVGRLLQGLKDNNRWDDTIVVLWSDHGFKLGEHHAWCKHTDFTVDTHVPFMIRVPGEGEGTETRTPVEAVDLFATTAEAAGLPSVPSCSFDPSQSGRNSLCTEGRSLMPLLRGESLPAQPALSQYRRAGSRMGYSMLTSDGMQRFTVWVDWDGKKTSWTPQEAANDGIAFEFYKHTVDPKEKYNLAQNASDPRVLELFETLKAHYPQRSAEQETDDDTPELNSSDTSAENQQLIVNFDANNVANAVGTFDAFSFDPNVPRATVAGQPIYGSFHPKADSGGRRWAVSPTKDSGLKLRFNPGKGTADELIQGTFMWKKDDFLNGLNGENVTMDTNTAINFRAGYLPGGTPRAASAHVSFIIKDSSDYHISEPYQFMSGSALDLAPLSLTYSLFDPYESNYNTTSGEVSSGNSSNPTFNNIVWVGFRIGAYRGTDIANGVNIGIVRFSVSAFAT